MAESNEAQVDLREMWPSEPYDFTPWLADHLEHLGRAVGLRLEPLQQEQQIGSFSLDILARETNENVMVAIENQLEWTDHSLWASCSPMQPDAMRASRYGWQPTSSTNTPRLCTN